MFYAQYFFVLHVHEGGLVLDGLDFFFGCPQDAKKFVSFLQSVVPCRYIDVTNGNT